MQLKNGFLTSEFWQAFVPMTVSVGVLTGFIPANAQSDFAELVKQAIMGIIAIVSIVSYILGRTELKKEAIKSAEKPIG